MRLRSSKISSARLISRENGIVVAMIRTFRIGVGHLGGFAVCADPNEDYSFLAFRNSGFKALDSRRQPQRTPSAWTWRGP
jgi:hypothetical protein